MKVSLHLPRCTRKKNPLCNAKKFLLLTNYFKFEVQTFVFVVCGVSKKTSAYCFATLSPPKSQFRKAFPTGRALTVWWAHSYSVRKWRKVA